MQEEIKIRVYYSKRDNGIMVLDFETMQEMFEEEMEKLGNKTIKHNNNIIKQNEKRKRNLHNSQCR